MKILRYAISDIRHYIKFDKGKQKSGYIYGYVADTGKPFGSGKTLTMVNVAASIANSETKRPVVIYSNIRTNISKANNIRIHSFDELLNYLDKCKDDVLNILLIDEIGIQFNSRSFSTNFTPDFLAKLCTCRKYNLIILYTAQSFNMVDKIFRELTTSVFVCSHKWRFFKYKEFNPLDFENNLKSNILVPVSKKKYFATDELYSLYDTLEAFESIKKDVKTGNYLSREEIIKNYDSHTFDNTSRKHSKSIFRRRVKDKTKQ